MVFRKYRKGGARPKGLVGWGHGGGSMEGQGDSPEEVLLGGAPLCSARSLSLSWSLLTHHSASAKVLPPHSAGCLNPGPAGLTQWSLSPKLKLLQNKNPSPCIPLPPRTPPPHNCSSELTRFTLTRTGRGSPLPETMHTLKPFSAPPQVRWNP